MYATFLFYLFWGGAFSLEYTKEKVRFFNFRISKTWAFVLTLWMGFCLVFVPGAAHANSHGQIIEIYYNDGGMTQIVSDGTDICTQVNNLSYASNCNYPSNVHGMGYVNGEHRVYAVRNGSGHQPVVTHPRPHPIPQTTYPQTGHGSTVVIDGREFHNVQGDACQFMYQQGYRECYYDHERSNNQAGYHVLSSTPIFTSHRDRPTVFCLGGTGTDVSGALCFH